MRLRSGVIAFVLILLAALSDRPLQAAGPVQAARPTTAVEMPMPVSKPEVLSHGRFKKVEVFRPQGEVKHFALLMSGDGGWTSRLARMAGAFARVDPIGNDDGEGVLCATTNGATHAPQGAIGEALLRRSASAARTPVAQLGRELIK